MVSYGGLVNSSRIIRYSVQKRFLSKNKTHENDNLIAGIKKPPIAHLFTATLDHVPSGFFFLFQGWQLHLKAVAQCNEIILHVSRFGQDNNTYFGKSHTNSLTRPQTHTHTRAQSHNISFALIDEKLSSARDFQIADPSLISIHKKSKFTNWIALDHLESS